MTATWVQATAEQALGELRGVFAATDDRALESLCDELLHAKRIAVHGVGREGLMMRALTMRLMHVGLDAHVVGDVTTPPLGPGDLLVASAGPGSLPTVDALLDVARAAGARRLVITAHPDGPTSQRADAIVHLPAQTMADDSGARAGVLPMGSLFESAQLLFFDLLSIRLRERTGQSSETMRARHTNLE